jgi:hypothetical protein
MKNRTFRPIRVLPFLAAAVLLLTAGLTSALAAPPRSGMMSKSATPTLLDGKAFTGTMGERGKTSGDSDELTFTAGHFHSSACDQYGFTAAAYTSHREGDAIHFKAVTQSPKEGTMTWTGTVKGNALDASILWQKSNGQAVHYWYRGTQKPA